jgi:hypothetical protein
VLAGLLVSDGLRAEFVEPFNLLIGSWDLGVTWHDDEGAVVRRTQGEWHFGWALDGRAVEDVCGSRRAVPLVRWTGTVSGG